MIRVTLRNDSLVVEGHAGYARVGSDIVCAGVSALVETAKLSIASLTHSGIDIIDADGYIWMGLRGLDDRGRVIVDALVLGLSAIAESYPEYICMQ